MPVPAQTGGLLARLAAPYDPRFQQARSDIITSEPFLNLQFKRQVHWPFNPFFAPRLPKVVPMNRWEHVWRVMEVGASIGQALGLNIWLIDAGTGGHDCGHVTEGHYGEEWIRKHSGQPFYHEYFGIVAFEKIVGIQLPHEVAQCIALHSWSSGVMNRPDVTEECRVVAIADKIAYTVCDALEARCVIRSGGWNHVRYEPARRKELVDELDALLAGIYPDYRPFLFVPRNRGGTEVPPSTFRRWKRENRITNTDRLTFDMLSHLEEEVVRESVQAGQVSFQHSATAKAFAALRSWLYANIYRFADDHEQEDRDIAAAFSFIEKHYPRLNPYLVLAQFNDLWVRRAAVLGKVRRRPSELADDSVEGLLGDIERSIPSTLLSISEHGDDVDMFAIPDWVHPPTPRS